MGKKENLKDKEKYICHLGPGEDMPGGMLSVIQGYLNSVFLSEYSQKHIATTSSSKKIKALMSGFVQYCMLLVTRRVKVVHIHMSERGSCYRTMLWILMGKAFKIPIIVHSHGSELEVWYKNISKWKRGLVNRIMQYADSIIVLTPGWINFWNNIVKKEKIQIIPNWIDIRPYKEKKYYHNNVLNIAFLGYVGERKGTYDLLRAVKILKEQGVEVFLRIGGNGEVDRCKNLVKELGLEKEVAVCGWLNREEKQAVLDISDCLVLASQYESFGIVILEAMINQVPAISGDKGYSKEIIEDKYDGLVAESGNAQSIAQCLKVFLKRDTLKQYGDLAYEKAVNDYSEQVVIEKLRKVYSEFS